MDVVSFFVLCVIVVCLAALAVWAIGYFAPGHPAMVDKLIWGVAVLVILVTLVQAIGLLGHSPRIPHL